MSKLSKILLVLAAIGFISGLAFSLDVVNAEKTPALYIALPLGAVFLGMFLIAQMLNKESILYDQEHKLHSATENECCCGCAKPSPKGTLAKSR